MAGMMPVSHMNIDLPGTPIPSTMYSALPGIGYCCSVNANYHPVITYWVVGLWFGPMVNLTWLDLWTILLEFDINHDE